ncbi:MAG: hypothetical protein ACRCXX_02045 [Cetobacterium sp.]|uniref:hypothetical protein n=1 Tax=Cetobacterium sp. TaxID=2071632 RepID=UPI003F29F977
MLDNPANYFKDEMERRMGQLQDTFLADGDLLSITALGYANFYKKILTHKKAVTDVDSGIPEHYTLYLKTLLNSQSQHAMKLASQFVEEMNKVSDRYIGQAFKFDNVAMNTDAHEAIFLSSMSSLVNVFLALTGAMDKIINNKFDENELTSYLDMTHCDLGVLEECLSRKICPYVNPVYVKQANYVLDAIKIVYTELFESGVVPQSKLMSEVDTQLVRSINIQTYL